MNKTDVLMVTGVFVLAFLVGFFANSGNDDMHGHASCRFLCDVAHHPLQGSPVAFFAPEM